MTLKGYARRAFQAVAAAVIAAPLLAFSAAAQDNQGISDRQEVLVAPAPATQQVSVLEAGAGGESNPLVYIFPWLLLTGMGLPALWWLLKTQQPPPQDVRYPLARLMAGLKSREETPDQTPLWQLYLRMTAAAMIITGMAQPVIDSQLPLAGEGPLVIVVDNDWAAADKWSERVDSMAAMIRQAEREGRMVVVLPTAQPGDGSAIMMTEPLAPARAQQVVAGLQPQSWPADREAALQALDESGIDRAAGVVWLSNDLGDEAAAAFSERLQDIGPLTVFQDQPGAMPMIAESAPAEGTAFGAVLRRVDGSLPEVAVVIARGFDGREIARQDVVFETGQLEGRAEFELPAELRNEVFQFALENAQTAGGIVLLDERWRRRPVGLIDAGAATPAQPLLDEFFYIGSALSPYVDLRRGGLDDVLGRELSVAVIGDSTLLDPAAQDRLDQWVRDGGTLLRFAGPRLAERGDDLLPLDLRHEPGGRSTGGDLSWGEPLKIDDFDEGSPFSGLSVPGNVTVGRQVLAQPGLDENQQVWASLEDGTPLVSAEKRGEGWVVLVHTTASPEWSNLSMSASFVDMLRAVVAHSQGVGGAGDRPLPPWQALDGYGRLGEPQTGAQALAPGPSSEKVISAHNPPGLYGDDSMRQAVNVADAVETLQPLAPFVDGAIVGTYAEDKAKDLRGPLIALALGLALIDLMATMGQRGHLPFLRRRRSGPAPAP